MKHNVEEFWNYYEDILINYMIEKASLDNATDGIVIHENDEIVNTRKYGNVLKNKHYNRKIFSELKKQGFYVSGLFRTDNKKYTLMVSWSNVKGTLA